MARTTRIRDFIRSARGVCLGFALFWAALAVLVGQLHAFGAPSGLARALAAAAVVSAGIGLFAPERWCRYLLSWSILSQDMVDR